MNVLALSPHTLVCARGVLERRSDQLVVTLGEKLGSELRQLPTLLRQNQPCGLVILGGDGSQPSRHGGQFRLTLPMMSVKPNSAFPPPLRVIEPTFSVCITTVTVIGEQVLEIGTPLASSVAATILSAPAFALEVATASLAADKHLQEMTVYQSECFGIRQRGLVISYCAPLELPHPKGVEPTTSLWLNGSGDEQPLFAGIPELKF